MPSNEQDEVYRAVIERLESCVEVGSDGLLALRYGHPDWQGAEAAAYSDFIRSLEVTNRKISAGEISADDVMSK